MSTTGPKALQRHIMDPLFRQHVAERALQIAAISVVLNILLFATVIWEISRPVENHFIYFDQFGHPRELLTTDSRAISDGELGEWAVHRIVNLYTMNFKNVDDHLNEARTDFNVGGWNGWFSRFREKGNVTFIKQYRVYVSSIAQTAPSILEEGVDAQKHYMWRLRFRLAVTWENNQPPPVNDHYQITMTVRRTANPIYKSGLEITQLDAVPVTGGDNG